jgi:hypothetical protein
VLDNVRALFYAARMNWDLAIERNREPLLRIIAGLFAMIGLSEGAAIDRLARPLYRSVLLVLRPAEAAVRRLIVVAARGLVVKPSPERQAPKDLKISRKGQGQGQGRLSFRLFDPRKRFDAEGRPIRRRRPPRVQPRIRVIDFDPRSPLYRSPPPAPPAPAPKKDDTVNAQPLCRRLLAIKLALDDLPRQAQRLARWRSRPVAARRPRLTSPLRPGAPPGRRKRPTHEVHEILKECHWLAHNVPAIPNTS